MVQQCCNVHKSLERNICWYEESQRSRRRLRINIHLLRSVLMEPRANEPKLGYLLIPESPWVKWTALPTLEPHPCVHALGGEGPEFQYQYSYHHRSPADDLF